jgi:hypothetical protein
MKHRRASGFLLAAAIGAGVSLSDAPSALSQVVTPDCEHTATAAALVGGALNAAVPVKIGVDFNGASLVLTGSSGKVISDPLDLASLGMADREMVITGVRLRTNIDNDVRFFASSSESPEWVEAYRCDNVAISEDFCVRLPKAAGRSLRWMAVLSDSAGVAAIHSVQPIFDYLEDDEHFRGGIAVHEQVAYLGSFSQPGNLGQVYALANSDFGTEHWTAREELPSDGERKIYTASADGTQRFDFVTDPGNDPVLAPVLGVAEAEVAPLVNWVRGQRFGAAPAPLDRFGGVISSTPVVVGRPELPVWFLRATDTQRNLFKTFQQNGFARPPLVLYGGKDGMVHALHTDSRNLTDNDMGKEAWAFIPGGIAPRMAADFASNVVSAYPDTWPVVDDVLINGAYRTIAVLAHGRGGTGISTIDITDSVSGTASTSYVVNGPVPLWEQIPQDTAPHGPGLALSRPAIARVERTPGVESFMVIAGTGVSYHDPDLVDTNGRIVMAFDAADGTVIWKFRTMCPLTTAITVFETNDLGEADQIEIGDDLEVDGFMDRAVFGDRCGYIYKINLIQEPSAGGWVTGIGILPTEVTGDGTQLRALFQTDFGRPVTGNIAARAVLDAATTQVALFFGTGGLEEAPPYEANTFYALAAAPAAPGAYVPEELVIQRLAGNCSSPTSCEKFYGGVRVNPRQVIFTRVIEPPIGVGGAACDTERGSTVIESRSLIGDLSTALDQTVFAHAIDGVITGPLAMAGNAIYFPDARGRLTSIGDTTTPGTSFAADQLSITRTNAPMLILGWRQIY